MYKQTTSCGQVGLVLHNIFDKYLKYKIDGTFVEIGANDGKIGSFTYNLAKIGWTGLYCEPVPHIYNLCVENHKDHKNVITLKTGCGSKKEKVHITVAGTLSTIDNEMLEMYKNTNWATNCLKKSYKTIIEIDKLDDILEQNNIEKIVQLINFLFIALK